MTEPRQAPQTTEKDLRDYVWNYFQVHASQRLTTFNFYLALSTAVTTGLFATLHETFRFPLLGVVLGVLLVAFSFVFWKLDQRNRELIWNSEEALTILEDSTVGNQPALDKAKVFSNERARTAARKSSMNPIGNFRAYPYSYSRCFDMVFILFALLGVAGTIFSVESTVGLVDWVTTSGCSDR